MPPFSKRQITRDSTDSLWGRDKNPQACWTGSVHLVKDLFLCSRCLTYLRRRAWLERAWITHSSVQSRHCLFVEATQKANRRNLRGSSADQLPCTVRVACQEPAARCPACRESPRVRKCGSPIIHLYSHGCSRTPRTERIHKILDQLSSRHASWGIFHSCGF